MTANGRWTVTPHASLTRSLRPDPLIKLLLMRGSCAHHSTEPANGAWNVSSSGIARGAMYVDKIDVSLLIPRFLCAYEKAS
jgi:hypothetical protein